MPYLSMQTLLSRKEKAIFLESKTKARENKSKQKMENNQHAAHRCLRFLPLSLILTRAQLYTHSSGQFPDCSVSRNLRN